MSLLLDALKKAAEKNAEKNRKPVADDQTTLTASEQANVDKTEVFEPIDETVLDAEPTILALDADKTEILSDETQVIIDSDEDLSEVVSLSNQPFDDEDKTDVILNYEAEFDDIEQLVIASPLEGEEDKTELTSISSQAVDEGDKTEIVFEFDQESSDQDKSDLEIEIEDKTEIVTDIDLQAEIDLDEDKTELTSISEHGFDDEDKTQIVFESDLDAETEDETEIATDIDQQVEAIDATEYSVSLEDEANLDEANLDEDKTELTSISEHDFDDDDKTQMVFESDLDAETEDETEIATNIDQQVEAIDATEYSVSLEDEANLDEDKTELTSIAEHGIDDDKTEIVSLDNSEADDSEDKTELTSLPEIDQIDEDKTDEDKTEFAEAIHDASSSDDIDDEDRTQILSNELDSVNKEGQDSEIENPLPDEDNVFIGSADDEVEQDDESEFIGVLDDEPEDESLALVESTQNNAIETEENDDSEAEGEDPSLKLALSDEEIVLTDDDVTAFMGEGNVFDTDELSLEKADTELTFSSDITDSQDDKTTTESLSLSSYSEDSTTSIRLREGGETTTNLGETTHLRSLTNESINPQDKTTTQTLASDNYDRTLIKLEEDVSKVFTGMKSAKPGEVMTPDFAKKVFVSKSSSLKRQHYKVYFILSLLILSGIGVFGLFEMQSQMTEIDDGLVRLKRNPVPAELRLKRKKDDQENLAVLDGNLDTEALKLLKQLSNTKELENKSENTAKLQQQMLQKEPEVKAVEDVASMEVTDPEPQSTSMQPEPSKTSVITENLTPSEPDEIVEPMAKIEPKEKPKAQKATSKPKAVKKKSINIKTNYIKPEVDIWLNSAYQAYTKGDLEMAENQYAKVLEKQPKNRDALLGQAAILIGQNKSNQAIQNYQTVLLDNPKDPLALTSLMAASSIDPKESESRLKLMQKQGGPKAYLDFAIGNSISAQNRWIEAQQYYFKAYQAEPSNPDYAYNLAVSMEQINKSDVAVIYYEQALKNSTTATASFDSSLIEERIEVLQQ